MGIHLVKGIITVRSQHLKTYDQKLLTRAITRDKLAMTTLAFHFSIYRYCSGQTALPLREAKKLERAQANKLSLLLTLEDIIQDGNSKT